MAVATINEASPTTERLAYIYWSCIDKKES